jgi:hypothetical protein
MILTEFFPLRISGFFSNLSQVTPTSEVIYVEAILLLFDTREMQSTRKWLPASTQRFLETG